MINKEHAQDEAVEKRGIETRLVAEGISVGSGLDSLLRDPERLREVAPVLVSYLSNIRSPRLKIDIVRAAAGTEIPPKALIAELRRLRPEIKGDEVSRSAIAQLSPSELSAKLKEIRSQSTGRAALAWAICEALGTTADETVFTDIVEILRDDSYGRARRMLPDALARIRNRREEVVGALLGVLDDAEITAHVLIALGGLRAVEATSAVRRHLESSDPLVRSQAGKTLRILERAAAGPSASVPPPGSVPEAKSTAGLAEASANFDAHEVGKLLERFAALVQGFGAEEARLVESRMLEMGPDEEASFDFRVRFEGSELPVRITIFMGDVAAPVIGFFTPPGLAEAVQRLMSEL